MSGARYPIFPTRMALTVMKTRLKGAITGHSLLKKKSDALTVRFRAILKQITNVHDTTRHDDTRNELLLRDDGNIFFSLFLFHLFFLLSFPHTTHYLAGQKIDG
jgi:hypothetical protein